MNIRWLLLLVILVAGCDSERLKNDANPLHLPSTDFVADVAKGEALYQQNCQSCHGAGASGSDQGPPLLSKIYNPAHHADLSFHLAVKNGVRSHHWSFGDMPPLPEVTPESAGHIIGYIRQLQKQHKPKESS
jgi:mono/diheme cytochrome c family protein